MKEIQSKMKALEWSQHYPSLLRRSMAANSIIGEGIWTNFKLIQAFMVVRVTCKIEAVIFKNEGPESSQHFSHYKSMGIFPNAQGQLTPCSP